MRLLAIGGLGAALLVATAGCGTAASPCDQVQQEQQAVIDAYCSGKDATCWYCKCLNLDQTVKVERDGSTVVFSCVDEASPAPAACEGAALTQAQECLKNEQSCIDDAATLEATSKCGATKP